MPDFKGRKDFPEVADDKIKIGDYSGVNRLSVVDIYSPKGEPALRDQMIEPVKGETNNYDSPILSQQPVIVLSDVGAEEATLIKAIDGYIGKDGQHGDITVTSPSGSKKVIPTEDLPGAVGAPETSHEENTWSSKPYPQGRFQESDFDDPSGREAQHASLERLETEPHRTRGTQGRSVAKGGRIAKRRQGLGGGKRKDAEPNPMHDAPNTINVGSVGAGAGQGLGLRGQEAAKKESGKVTSIKPGDPGHEEMLRETQERAAANRQQGHTQNRPLISPVDKSDRESQTNIGEGHQSQMREAADDRTGQRVLLPPSDPSSDIKTRKINKSMDIEEPSRSWSYQG